MAFSVKYKKKKTEENPGSDYRLIETSDDLAQYAAVIEKEKSPSDPDASYDPLADLLGTGAPAFGAFHFGASPPNPG